MSFDIENSCRTENVILRNKPFPASLKTWIVTSIYNVFAAHNYMQKVVIYFLKICTGKI